MTNAIANVPRDLLERVLYLMDNYIGTTHTEEDELRALLSAPSPAGVDGLEVVGVLCISRFRNNPAMENVEFQLAADVAQGQHDLCRLSDAQAIIDGLRGENQSIQQELRLHQSQIESSGRIADRAQRFAVLLRTERDQQAKRIGELEQILRDLVPGCKWRFMRPRIDAALAEIDHGNE